MPEDQPDIGALQSYLAREAPEIGDLQRLEKFSDGQSNPTYRLDTSSGQYVLRRQPPGELLKSAHAVDREYRVISALRDSEVPVARAIHLCEDRDVIGSLFYLMSYEPGRIFWDPCLPELDKAERAEIYREMNRVLAALHDVDVDRVGLADFGRPGNYFERQVSRWSGQYHASEVEPIPAMDRLIEWLLQPQQQMNHAIGSMSIPANSAVTVEQSWAWHQLNSVAGREVSVAGWRDEEAILLAERARYP